MLGCLAVSVFLGFIYTKRQTGNRFQDHPDAGVHRGKLDRCLGIDRFTCAAGVKVEHRSSADAVAGLVPRTEQSGEGIFYAEFLLSLW